MHILSLVTDNNPLSLTAGQTYAECSNESILQSFRPSLSYQFVLSIFEWPFYVGFTVAADSNRAECVDLQAVTKQQNGFSVEKRDFVICEQQKDTSSFSLALSDQRYCLGRL